MDGVTILQTIDVIDYVPRIGVASVIFFLLFLGLFIGAMYYNCDCGMGYENTGYLLFSASILCLIVSLFLTFYLNPEITGQQYQVLIDDSVSMKEFTQHYQIIEQQGITYIVEEIEESD
jgi:hypothetical protein